MLGRQNKPFCLLSLNATTVIPVMFAAVFSPPPIVTNWSKMYSLALHYLVIPYMRVYITRLWESNSA